ncbi:MAG: sugar nucleotide-binding protein, partial [Desulfosarcina sp.]|nr:sugar nucleotide-binding protein [Desulfosarcina sp.]MBC2767913.1 sugar nucleotide-binding protein [Desulfosarcina sp.]
IRNVKFCEEHPDEANCTNAEGTGNVARACARIGAKLIYLSTDVVFSSTKGHYHEYDIPHSSLAYGRSKYRGETLAIQEMENIAICRSAGVYGKGSPLLHWFAGEIEKGKEVECFLDVFNTPTFAINLGEMLKQIIDCDLTGIFHTVGRQRMNRYDFFSLFANAFNLDIDKIKPVNAGERRRELMLMPDSSLSSKYTIERLAINANSPAEGFLRLKATGGF